MIQQNRYHKRSTTAFTLIEIVIAMAITAIALISLIGVLPVGLKNEKESLDHSALGTVFEDVHERLEGVILEAGVPDSVSPIFYDLQGVYIDPEEIGEVELDRYFRIEVELIEPAPEHNINALAVKISAFWPVNEADGNLITVDQEPGSQITYYAAALTGPGWNDTDPTYQPKIEY